MLAAKKIILKDNKHNDLHLAKNMLRYLSLDIVCSTKVTVFPELRSRPMLELNLSNSVEIQTLLSLWYYISRGSISQCKGFRTL